MELQYEQIAAMAVAVIAEETKDDIQNLRVVSFKEVQKSNLERYLEKYGINFKKYQLEDEII